jgi:hypothetical protein
VGKRAEKASRMALEEGNTLAAIEAERLWQPAITDHGLAAQLSEADPPEDRRQRRPIPASQMRRYPAVGRGSALAFASGHCASISCRASSQVLGGMEHLGWKKLKNKKK